MNIYEVDYYKKIENNKKMVVNNILSTISNNMYDFDTYIINNVNLPVSEKDALLNKVQDLFDSIKTYCINVGQSDSFLNPYDKNWLK